MLHPTSALSAQGAFTDQVAVNNVKSPPLPPTTPKDPTLGWYKGQLWFIQQKLKYPAGSQV